MRAGIKLIKDVDVFFINGKWVRKRETVLDNYTNKRYLASNHNLHDCVILDSGKIGHSSKVIIVDNQTTCASILKDKSRKLYDHLGAPDCYSTGRKATMYTDKARNKSLYSFSQKAIHPDLPTSQPFSKILSPYTYGFEIETANGEVSDVKLYNYGFTTVYDGSIQGHEIVSKPMAANELKNVGDLVTLLPFCCSIDQSCSLHIHIGNIPRTEKNLIKLYDIFYKLQDELWLMVPYYKKEIGYLKNLDKDYVKNLLKFSELTVENIMKFFGLSGYRFRDLENLNHILTNNRKWALEGRYHFINFLNYICKSVGTIEIRLLQSTFSWKLIQTWLLVNVLIIDYALNNDIVGSKTKIEISDIIKASNMEPKIRDILTSNITRIKNIYFNQFLTRGFNYKNLENVDSIMNNELMAYD